jgi:hypothetical protein
MLAAAVVMLLAFGIAAGALSSFWETGDGATYGTGNGLEVSVANSIKNESGDPFTGTDEITLANISFRGTGSVTVDSFNSSAGGDIWTNTSQFGSNRVDIDRPDGRPVGGRGTVDSLAVRSVDLSDSNDEPDVVATAGGDWTLIVEDTGLSQGSGVVVRDADTGKALDSAPVESNGTVFLDELESVNNDRLDVEPGPSELRVYNASEPSVLADSVDLQIRIFTTDEVFERTVSNGRLDLTDIPKDKLIVITVDEPDSTKYVYRRTVLENLAQQQEVYLLSSANTNVASVVFELDDRTGRFDAESTRLFVQRPITKDFDGDGSTETRYQNVVGDTFGGTGEFPTVLQADQRYRLIVDNNQGDRRVLGSYTAQVDDRAIVQIGRVTIDVPDGRGYVADLRDFTQDSDGDGTDEQFVRVVYKDADERTEQLEVEVIELESNTTLASETVTRDLGTYVQTFQVNSSATNTSYKLEWSAQREQDDGTAKTISGEKYAGDVPPIAAQWNIDPRWLELVGYMTVVATAGLLVLVDTALGATAATAMASLLTVIGVIAVPLPALGLAGVISFSALVGREVS